MIRFLINSEIDYNKWDNCIERSYNGNLYAWSWYLDLVCEGWDAIIAGDYEQVMPVTAGKKYGIKYLYQPPFTQQLGIFSTTPESGYSNNDFLEILTHHYRFAEINLNRYNRINNNNFKINFRKNYELDLIKPYEQLQGNYSENTRRNIKKAVKEGINISENSDHRSIIKIFRQEKGREIKKMGERHYKILEKLIYRSLYKNIATVSGAFTHENRLCAGVFIIRSHHRLVLIFSANNSIARNTGAMHLLIDSIIKKYAGQALTLDFEGSEIEGLARFYAGFGSAETRYPALQYNNLPFFVKLIIEAMKRTGLK
ncbi:MAG TPA: hypothetical protein PK908_01975 [Bacteroidales bacterium]|nr:hypothetical protein [Bacteroidales bacterium]